MDPPSAVAYAGDARPHIVHRMAREEGLERYAQVIALRSPVGIQIRLGR